MEKKIDNEWTHATFVGMGPLTRNADLQSFRH